jgi:hypothetical protein
MWEVTNPSIATYGDVAMDGRGREVRVLSWGRRERSLTVMAMTTGKWPCWYCTSTLSIGRSNNVGEGRRDFAKYSSRGYISTR